MLYRLACALAFSLFAAPAFGIIGGEADGNRHPFVGAIDVRPTGRTIPCTGTLIAPTVFLTAGHCADFFLSLGITQASVSFDPVFSDLATFHTGTIHLHPGYRSDPASNRRQDSHDVAVIVFGQAVAGVTPAALPAAGLLDALGPNALRPQAYPVVGFGISRLLGGRDGGGPRDIDRSSAGTRKTGDWRLMSVTPDWVRFDMQDARACTGDSGAPNFLGDSRLIVGIGIGGDSNCETMSANLRVDTPAVRAFLSQFVTLP
ncbi:trypsin-like serine protease [Aquabacterium humicola]|uniref:trypsin-like serine protease n=1 Tax=Aquabacterium humicola TaxID=3237377 RepID=UPI002542ECC3|nr:trypsin-like serine protease [Rubrivivax pictus]